MNHNELLDMASNIHSKCMSIMKQKNADYSKEDNALANFKRAEWIGIKASQGIMIRLSDKMARIENLLIKERQVKDETIQNTILDAINYLILLLAQLQEENSKNQEDVGPQ